MTPEQFAYWLQGFIELHGEPPTKEQWLSIQQHLGTVFNKVTPSIPKITPADPYDSKPYKWPDGHSDWPQPPQIIC